MGAEVKPLSGFSHNGFPIYGKPPWLKPFILISFLPSLKAGVIKEEKNPVQNERDFLFKIQNSLFNIQLR